MRHLNLITRTLLIIFLYAGVINQTFSQTGKAIGPYKITSSSKLSPKVSTTAKLFMVIAYLETKPNYKEGMSKEEFLNSMLAGVEAKSVPALKKYFGTVYDYHKQNMHPDEVYQKTDDKAFIAVYNDLVGLYKPKMSKPEFKRVVGLESLDNVRTKPWWINWLRKVIDFIDDNWK